MNFGNHFFHITDTSGDFGKEFALPKPARGNLAYDPELLYVECQVCGKPVLWEAGKTTELLAAAEIDMSTLDHTCLLISDGCPVCSPEEWEGFNLSIVRLAGIPIEDALYMLKPGGNA